MRDIMKRIEALERKIRPQHLTVLAILDGQKVEMTVQECIDKEARFVKVLDGCNFNDIDLILNEIFRKEALEEAERDSSDE